jgi:cytochrome oxidase Cu insertion factor (SCO1/SenC/PrrC family)
MLSSILRRALLAAMFAVFALGALAPAARADGDPGSDVLVYQNLFAAADANVSVAQQVELGDLLTAADSDGFQIRVAIIATPADLGAITALWDKPASYARFLGVELSLAYAQRLLVVMPDGFGFNWQGHSTAAAYRVLGKLPIGRGGNGLAAAAETAVRALASASGVRLAVPASGGTPSANAASGAGSGSAGAGTRPASGGQPAAAPAPSGLPVPLIVAIAAGALAAVALGGWLARRAGLRLPAGLRLRIRPVWRRPPRLAIPGTWLAGGFVGLVVVLIAVHALVQPSGGAAQGSVPGSTALAANPNLDPGTALSGTAPGFTLTDQFGQPVSLSSYRGKVVILAFNDAECTTVCPLTSAALVDVKAMLGKAGSQVQLLGVDANPKAISVEDLFSYSQLHGMLYQWRYLTGSLSQLQSVWKAYSIGVDISQGQIDHEPAIFVISPQGKLARLYLTQMAYSAIPQLGQLLAREAASLLPGHPAVQSHLSYAQVSGISPATAAPLPAAGGGYVSLGPGQPRLYLFFATWDQEITSLGGQLDALNAYQSAAGRAGLPGLTAIDEGSVEPSATALPNFLATLGQPLSYPVAIDGSGQVADGYGVQGEPWFVLTSAAGKVIWSWQVSTAGWLSPASLDQHVRAALGSAAKKAAG